jgi:hypothetical protein
MSHFGYKVEKGKPILTKVQRTNPRPIKTAHSRAFMRQENEDRSGKYFKARKIAFEDATEQWLILYESKELKLMNEGSKYLDIFEKYTSDESDTVDESDSIKKATYVIEFSATIHKVGRMVLESLCRSSEISAKRGRFIVIPPLDEKRLFDTDTITEKHYPLMRQCSNEVTKTDDFRVSCRPIEAEHIAIIFIVHHKDVRIHLPPIIDRKLYWELAGTPNVLLFKQIN